MKRSRAFFSAVAALLAFSAGAQPLPPEPPAPFFWMHYPQCKAADAALRGDPVLGEVLKSVPGYTLCSCSSGRVERDERMRPLLRAPQAILDQALADPENRNYIVARINAIRFQCMAEMIEGALPKPPAES